MSGIYAQIISELYGLNRDDIFKRDENSFFKYCFSSEINHIPSKYSENRKIVPERKKLLTNEFYRKFSNIIIGTKTYLKLGEISEIFGVPNKWLKILLGKIGKKQREITAFKCAFDYPNIIVCNQLSGAAGWSNEAIKNLVGNLKK